MGTNFYLMTKSRDVCDKHFGHSFELTDTPDWGYKIHIAKTSCGWLPLFQRHDCFKSIFELKGLYDTGNFIICDEYGDVYNWDEFYERVLKFNGGVRGAIPREEIKQDKNGIFYDKDLPKYKPISHLEYGMGRYSAMYYTDKDGYEFATHEFF